MHMTHPLHADYSSALVENGESADGAEHPDIDT
jgi:hypothetical protein